MLEVADLIKNGDTNGLAILFKGNHISEKLPQDLEIVILISNADAIEFRFAHEPTTYWTYARYVAKTNSNLSPSLPFSSSDLAPTVLDPSPPSPTPAPSPPLPVPGTTPSPDTKARVAASEDPEEGDNASRPPLRKHHRAKEGSSAKDVGVSRGGTGRNSDEEEVPESAKVWHRVGGHLKWYDKRNYHEVRRALPVAGTPTPVAVPYLNPSPTPYVTPRALVP